jgi:hypothetical protein
MRLRGNSVSDDAGTILIEINISIKNNQEYYKLNRSVKLCLFDGVDDDSAR